MCTIGVEMWNEIDAVTDAAAAIRSIPQFPFRFIRMKEHRFEETTYHIKIGNVHQLNIVYSVQCR